ncbi:blue light-inducible protein-like protein Bli-3 [Myriangium duriaei CBS 260.36]|uniref:Blue light-inducible protein-like protein Bli-3 n=1 Tax=Myriangium duriaei CBS 260.36 TaxID=1168546 RepID=A0A9P4IXI0_9PEZI|nr:blue light-inducible protein-like protein Bli-3 [Myriangium duriaei CBS 260.36]
MPEPVTKQDIEKGVDPTVARQWDETTTVADKFKDFYEIADKLKVCLMGTKRSGVGPVHRSMAVARRTGPDFLFLANNHSQKFKDLEDGSPVSLTFQNSSNQDWVSITGKATTASNSDPRIKEIWSRASSVWFGDVGDGVHDGSPDDPRMTLIEVKPTYISYWKSTVSAIGFAKEVIGANLTGGVPNNGDLRQMHEQDINDARARDSKLS